MLIVIAGVEGAGKGETVNQLNEWMDPRHVLTHGFAEPSDEELERPHLWRFWKALPPKGKVGVFFGAWHTEPVVQRVYGNIDHAGLRLITCGGLDAETNVFDENVVVFADLVPGRGLTS